MREAFFIVLSIIYLITMKRITPPTLLSALLIFSILFVGCKKDDPDINRPPLVNAGPSQTIKLPVDSVRLTGTVTNGSSKVLAYLWSEVSGPNTPVIADDGSLSTEVNGLAAGTYMFQLMAVDSFGHSGTDTMLVTVNSSQAIVLAPIDNPIEFEYLGYANGSDASGGANTLELGAEQWTVNGNPVTVRAAFGFDLSTLPNNVPIVSAKLTLYSNPTPGTGNLTTPNAGPANAMYIRRISGNWNPQTTVWSTQPATDTAGQVLVPHTDLSTLDLVGVDVTTLVRNMVSSGNYGFMIQLQNEAIYNSRIFCSSKYSDQTKRPQLVINY